MSILELVEIPSGPEQDRWIPVLELADQREPLCDCLPDGELFGFVGHDGAPRAAILVIERRPGLAELRAVAVADDAQGRGLGTQMIDAVLERLRSRGTRSVVVGTASSGVRQLAFYQRCGFRLSHVERDFFTPEKGYPPDLSENGIASRDMVWMDREL